MVSVRELQRSPGAMRALEERIGAPEEFGTPTIGIPAGSDIELDLRLEAVHEGVLVSGTATARAAGECVRCLDPIAYDLTVDVQELFFTDPEPATDEDGEALPRVEHESVDLEPLLRDAFVTDLPFQPVCKPDCQGLCPQCGVRLEDHPGHRHESRDPRWDALESLLTDPGETDQRKSN
ncbi:hypothetical protein GCM10011512_22450 [Tersicoccus solisilvae]|uniref:DNA-binding protein n=1 Tax=Tersicoccus solisilvae TaxID=1882339 RepID=A0ABQ1PD86_9MICC|nr:hypothetical protein GCM10011512_22450 [Tersicoccus solisilvae]